MAYQIVRSKDVPGEPRKTLKGAILLCDTSGSMQHQDTWTGKRRIDHLAEVLAYVLSRTKVQALVSFNHAVTEHKLVSAVSLEEPSGGTDLALALEHVRDMAQPEQLLILSDGEPNDQELALLMMERLLARWGRLPVRCYFCGDDKDHHAKAFLERLAGLGGPGSGMEVHNLATPKRLAQAVVLQITHVRS